MPASLAINPPSSAAFKRQRSQDGRVQGNSTGTTQPDSGEEDGDQMRLDLRIPRFLTKSKSDILAIYQDLEWKQRYRLAHAFQNPESSPYRVDRSPVVIERNRYGNVQPWDTSRIRLNIPFDGSDYVNASPILLNSGAAKFQNAASDWDREAAPHEFRYIATQGPKQGQYSHFWHMVMQETPGDVGVIIMLTQLYEANREKCSAYFPVSMEDPIIELPSPDNHLQSDESTANKIGSSLPNLDVSVKPTNSVRLLSYKADPATESELRVLKLKIDSRQKEIHHYLFTGWPDHGRPETNNRRALRELAAISKSIAQHSPRIVHCSAGVGRTGTFIAMDFLLQELESGALLQSSQLKYPSSVSKMDAQPRTPSTETWGKSGPAKASTPDPSEEDYPDLIYETVNKLREQRMMMVMNELQYQFIYDMVKEAFMDKYASKETGPYVVSTKHGASSVSSNISSRSLDTVSMDESTRGEPSTKIPRRTNAAIKADTSEFDSNASTHLKGKNVQTIYQSTKVGRDLKEEDTVSEAETEIMNDDDDQPSIPRSHALAVAREQKENQSETELPAAVKNSRKQGNIIDPYAAVAPETILRGMKKKDTN